MWALFPTSKYRMATHYTDLEAKGFARSMSRAFFKARDLLRGRGFFIQEGDLLVGRLNEWSGTVYCPEQKGDFDGAFQVVSVDQGEVTSKVKCLVLQVSPRAARVFYDETVLELRSGVIMEGLVVPQDLALKRCEATGSSFIAFTRHPRPRN